MKHENSGKCPRCATIFDRYPGFNSRLRAWFEAFQTIHPEAHISCAGRGRQDQEEACLRGASKAHYTGSAHNFNAAIDIFEMQGDISNIYETSWFKDTLRPAVSKQPWLTWYGEPGSEFFELPHVQLAEWREMVKSDQLKLVE